MKTTNFSGILNSSPRTFSFNQLSRISDDNWEVLNRCIDMSAFNNDDIFVLTPRLIHRHAYGEPVSPHLRTLVARLNNPHPLAYQDITFDQWDQGKELQKSAS